MEYTQIGADHLKNGTVYTTDQILDYYNAVVKTLSLWNIHRLEPIT
jgi:hypothetical protein